MTTSFTGNYKLTIDPNNPTASSLTGNASISYNTGKNYTPTNSYTPTAGNITLTAGTTNLTSPTNHAAGSYNAKVDAKLPLQSVTSPQSTTTRASYTSKPATTSTTGSTPTVFGMHPTLNLSGINRPPTQKLSQSPISNINYQNNLSTGAGSLSARGPGTESLSARAHGTGRDDLQTSRITTASVFKTQDEEAKAVAERFFNLYDRRRVGRIEDSQLGEVMSDTYRFIGQPFSARPQDTDAYFRILDVNSDGQISFEDIEALCQKYLFGVPIPENSVGKTDPSANRRADPSASGNYGSQSAGKYDPYKRTETSNPRGADPSASGNPGTYTSGGRYDPSNRTETSAMRDPSASGNYGSAGKYEPYKRTDTSGTKGTDPSATGNSGPYGYGERYDSTKKPENSTVRDPSASGTYGSQPGKYEPYKRTENATIRSTGPSGNYETFTSGGQYDPSRRTENSTMEKPDSFGGKPVRRGETEKRSAMRDDDEPPHRKAPEEEFAREIFDATKIFEKYDQDKSGYLEEHEIPFVLQETYKKIGVKKEVRPQDVKTYIATLDSNGDGKISLEEFIKCLVDTLVRDREKYKPVGTSYKVGGYQRPLYKTELEKARELFNRFDTDKSGYLDFDEIPALLQETNRILNINRGVTEEEVRNFLSTFDKNSDNKISFEEFTKLIQMPRK